MRSLRQLKFTQYLYDVVSSQKLFRARPGPLPPPGVAVCCNVNSKELCLASELLECDGRMDSGLTMGDRTPDTR